MNKRKKKGAVIDILVFTIMAFVIAAFIGIWLYGHNLLTSELQNITAPIGDGSTNVSAVVRDTMGQVNTAGNNIYPLIAFALMFGMILSILISNFLIKVHPVFFVLYLFFVVLAIVLAVVASNSYETVFISNAEYGQTFQNMGAVTFVLLNLPVWVTVVGFLGIVFLMIGVLRDRDLGGIA